MNTIFEKVDHYIGALLGQEDPSLVQATQLMERHHLPHISISPNQGKFLQVLALACKATKILELGTLGAYSTIWMAKILPEDGKVISVEFDAFHADIARENVTNAGLDHKIDIRRGAALDIMPVLEKEGEGPFDMIFIDADKPPYLEYFQWALRLSHPGTIIVADNVIRNGEVLEENNKDEKVSGVQRLNKWLSTCTEVTATIMQTVGVKEHDGMVIAVVNR